MNHFLSQVQPKIAHPGVDQSNIIVIFDLQYFHMTSCLENVQFALDESLIDPSLYGVRDV
jgi:hypothetical protein